MVKLTLGIHVACRAAHQGVSPTSRGIRLEREALSHHVE